MGLYSHKDTRITEADIHACTRTRARPYTRTYARTHTRTSARTHTHTHTHATHTHACTHTRTHTHTLCMYYYTPVYNNKNIYNFKAQSLEYFDQTPQKLSTLREETRMYRLKPNNSICICRQICPMTCHT